LAAAERRADVGDQRAIKHTLTASQVFHSEGVDGQRGLSSAEAAAQAQQFGTQQARRRQGRARWRTFGRQCADPMQIVLLAAGLGSAYPLRQLGRACCSSC